MQTSLNKPCVRMSHGDYLCFSTTPMNDRTASMTAKVCIPIVKDNRDDRKYSHQSTFKLGHLLGKLLI